MGVKVRVVNLVYPFTLRVTGITDNFIRCNAENVFGIRILPFEFEVIKSFHHFP